MTITKTFWRTAALLAGLSLAALAVLVVGDARHELSPSRFHGRAGGLALIFAGASYMVLHLGGSQGRGERGRALLLGAAFVLWGGEQFVSSGRFQTLMDLIVVAVFVIDLCLVIAAKFAQIPSRDGEK